MIKKHYNTVIIGAGPAGLACAITLMQNGVRDVLVAEKYKFPRNKCCAGYITQKTVKEYARFGLDTEECGYSYIEDFKLFFKHKLRQRIKNRFLLTSREINRVSLDYAFFRLAVDNGVQIEENMPVTGHFPEKNTVILCKNVSVEYDNIVFADGTFGFGSAYQKTKRRNLAMQLVFKSDIRDGIDIHFGVTKRGYCWVSSQNGVTNVGMTDEYRGSKDYKKQFKSFISDLGISQNTSSLYSAFTPIGVRKPVIGSNMYFAGDAMGACDPFTLSGVRNALISGEKAALSIARSDTRIIKRYARKLKLKFFFMRLLMKTFYVPCVRWLMFNVGCRFLGGMVTFVFNRLLNKK